MRVILSGCSGGGKSTLLEALAARGHAVVPEPGRRVVQAALAGRGGALPWEDAAGFARGCLALAAADWAAAPGGVVIFDRSGWDAIFWLEAQGLALPEEAGAVKRHRPDLVLLAPPWPELRVTDAERQGSQAEAEAEYRELARRYPELGAPVELLPKRPVEARVDWVEARLGR